jgi:excinuclease ABC subunit C
MEFKSAILAQIEKLPNRPGIYIFRGANEKPLYVGKAKHLKKRLLSYLGEDVFDWKIEGLRQNAERLDFKITNNELSALILEAKMIEALQPPFNIQLKHNNPFLYFYFSGQKLTKIVRQGKPEATPKFELVRETTKPGSYFGPFLNKTLARQLFDLLNKTFGLRSCVHKIAKGCLYYHLGQCAGYCLDDFDQEAYLKRFGLVKDFFKNGPQRFISHLGVQIANLNKELKFEEAGILSRYQNMLQASQLDLQQVATTSRLMAQQEHAQHVWLFDLETQLVVMLENKHRHLSKKELFHQKDFVGMSMDDFLCNYYRNNPPPLVIFTNFILEDKELFVAFLKAWYKQECEQEVIFFAQMSDNATFLDLALEIFDRELFQFQNLAVELQKFLSAPKAINKIDCFDVSHHQELFIVASCVRFENGKPRKDFYRQFRIKSTQKPNDYQSLREAVYRRYAGEEEVNLPDLVLIDGGKGQLNAVRKLFPDLFFAALAKREERIYYYTFSKTAIVQGVLLPDKSIIKLVLTNIRNHAHNFAIKYHRKLKNRVEV